ncbi:MAG TPA: Hsp70 family protein [Xanthomonadales bacterium]|nr:Hsp70 family protein [Xanthomonadales bacterium]
MIVGIDLGTTHSLIGYWRDGQPVLVPNALGSLLTPSVVGADEEGHVLVGASAREQLLTAPERTVAAFKRLMGSGRETSIGHARGRGLRPEELSALVLRSLIGDARAQGLEPTQAVISVPAYFSDAQRKATRAAAQLAGLEVLRLINEPTAAAVAYGLHRAEDERRFLVLDLGGGTFDVSLLETFDGVIEVHASAGDAFLGGEDFTDALFALCLSDLGYKPDALSPVSRAKLRQSVETIKRRLATEDKVEATLAVDDASHAWTVTQAAFERACDPLVARLRAPIERAVRDAGVQPASLDEIVLVGGASRMPMLARLVARMFGRLPLRHLQPDEVIALGAVTVAGMVGDAKEFKEVVLTDVCPYTMGVAVSRREADGSVIEGFFSPIIERNTVVPASRVERYSPMNDGQAQLRLDVYQGESPRVSGNVKLGELVLELPRRKASETAVDVRFSYDTSGLLEVEAMLWPEEKLHRIVIQRNAGVLAPEEVARRLEALAALKVHPREDQANRAVIARAERLYAELLGQARDEIVAALGQFEAELGSQDPQRIQRARTRFASWLDRFELVPL